VTLPWRTILTHGPTILEAARKLYERSRKAAKAPEPTERNAGGAESLRRAVEQLQAREVQHATLVADVARQLQDMATALEVLRARLRLALVGMSVAVAVAILTAALVMWRAG